MENMMADNGAHLTAKRLVACSRKTSPFLILPPTFRSLIFVKSTTEAPKNLVEKRLL
jgi:hypothetical protein